MTCSSPPPPAELSGIAAWRLTLQAPHTYATMASEGDWRPARHLSYVGREAAKAIYQGDGRLIVNMPPGHGKSRLLSEWLPVWYLMRWPERRVGLVSYGDSRAIESGRWVRDQIKQNPIINLDIRQDSTAAGRWHTSCGKGRVNGSGGMIAVGRGGALTGFRFDLIVIDDPLKNEQEAFSGLTRRRLVDWFQGTLYDRMEPGATIIVIEHRWHPDDLSGWLVSRHSDDWRHINLPAIATANDPMGRAEGEALWPERYSIDALERRRDAMGSWWPAKFQQDPESVGGGDVYSHFSSDNIDSEIALRDDLPLHLSIDFNIDPGMHMVVGQHDPMTDTFTAIYEIHDLRMTVERAMQEFADLIEDLGGWQWPELHVFGDATGRAASASTGQTHYDLVSNAIDSMHGGAIYRRERVPGANPPVVDRIHTTNDALRDGRGARHYLVHPRCERLIRDFREVRADDRGAPDKHGDHDLTHASDAEGYRVHYIRPVRRVFADGMDGGDVFSGGVSIVPIG